MAEVAPAAPIEAVPAKAPKKKAAPRPKKTGPSVGELVVKAIAASKEKKGVSLAALKKALATGGYDVEKNKARVKLAIKSLVTKGTLVQTKGTGASGSFKLNKAKAEPKKKAAPKTKKLAAKKTATAKKPKKAAAKKPAATKKSPKKAVKKPAAPKPKKATKSPKKAKKPAALKKATKSPKKVKAVKPKAAKSKAAKPKKAAAPKKK
ncbi:histone H1-like [Alosa pseudoharengus]|uniref:histone H1-like n=1 Tax=Alosa pseudoharengus TaxID=34774 RepID=UPI003F8A113A